MKQAEAGDGELEVAPCSLTADELAAFERAVSAGALRSLVAPWQPWWLAADAARLAISADGTAVVRMVAGAPECRGEGIWYGVCNSPAGWLHTRHGARVATCCCAKLLVRLSAIVRVRVRVRVRVVGMPNSRGG